MRKLITNNLSSLIKYIKNKESILALCLVNALFLLPFSMMNVSASGRVNGDISAPSAEMTSILTDARDGYATILYDNQKGLPTSEANAIVETSDGIIWIGSYSGLIKYDGKDFERVDSTTGISSVVRLFVDSRDRLWIGTNDNGVAVMERGKYVFFNHTNGLNSLSVRSIVEDSEGNVYIATTEGIAYIDKKMKMHQLDDPGIKYVYTRMLEMGSDDIAYGITMDGDVFTLKNKKLDKYYHQKNIHVKGVRTIGLDSKNRGYVYLGTEESDIYTVNLNHGFEIVGKEEVAPLKSLNRILDYDGHLWVCADNGISYRNGDKFQKLENLPMNNAIENMMADYQGNLWFTSSRQGVLKIVPSRFADLFEKYHLKDEVVNTTCVYDGSLFIGKDKGLSILREKSIENTYPLLSFKSVSGRGMGKNDLIKALEDIKIRSIIRGNDNTLWISTFSKYGLIHLNGKKAICYTEADGMPSSRIRSVAVCQDGSVLVAATGGVVVLKDEKIERVYTDKEGIKNTEVLTVCETKDGEKIVGTDGGGIYIISGDKVELVDYNKGLSSGIVMRVKYDSKRDLVWIVTSNSIAYMKNHKVKTLNNFPYSNNFDLYENTKGEMWVLSSNGVYVINTEKLMLNHKETPVFYNKDNGLQVIATANSYSDLTENGDLYIAGSTGVSKVNIEEEFENIDKIKVGLPYINVDGKTIYPDKHNVFVLEPSSKRITFYLGVYTYSLTNPKITVSLHGFGDKKNTMSRSELNPIVYTNLPGGKYSFDVEVRNTEGNHVKQFSFDIVKTKAVYEHVWFNLAMVFLVLAITIFIIHDKYRKNTEAIRKKAEEHKLLIREIVEAFAKTIDMKDKYTKGHSGRVAEYTSLLAKELGYDEETVWKYYNIALMHDIGKIGIPETVLNKPDKLTDEEYEIMKQHTVLGYNALKDISLMPEIAVGAGAHHERWDGKGYPRGIKGDEIPRVAQIIAVADTFDAMYSTRPYRKRVPFERVVSTIKAAAGTQLTADVVAAFLRLVDKGYFRAEDEEE